MRQRYAFASHATVPALMRAGLVGMAAAPALAQTKNPLRDAYFG